MNTLNYFFSFTILFSLQVQADNWVQVGEQCNCDGNVLVKSTKEFPDFESCKAECERVNCKYFGVWDSTEYPETCKMWDSCNSCNSAGHHNLVYELTGESEGSSLPIEWIIVIVLSVIGVLVLCALLFYRDVLERKESTTKDREIKVEIRGTTSTGSPNYQDFAQMHMSSSSRDATDGMEELMNTDTYDNFNGASIMSVNADSYDNLSDTSTNADSSDNLNVDPYDNLDGAHVLSSQPVTDWMLNECQKAETTAAGNCLQWMARAWEKLDAVEVMDMTSGVNSNVQIPFSELQVGENIGSGSFGSVHKGKWKGGEVAIKFCTKETMDTIQTEIDVFLSVRRHPNILNFYGICENVGKESIVMEYFLGGSVYDLFNSGKLTLGVKVMVLTQAAAGIHHLHDSAQPVIHRDIACRNVLINIATNKVVISDFGLSRQNDDASTTDKTESTTGPIRWLSPESLTMQQYSTASDVWMFGAMIIELMREEMPYAQHKNIQVIESIAFRQKLPKVDMADWPDDIRSVALSCLQFHAPDRPTMKELMESFNQIQE